MEHSARLEIEIYKISRRPPENAKFGHFTLLFCGGRKQNLQRFIIHVHSCSEAD